MTTDLNSPYPITFDQTLWKTVSFQKYPFISGKNPIWNFENLTTDLNSPYPIAFDQTLWETVRFQKYPFIGRKNPIWNIKNLRTDSDSAYLITYVRTMFKPKMSLNNCRLKWMFFWPQIRTFRPRLPKVQLCSDHQWSTTSSY